MFDPLPSFAEDYLVKRGYSKSMLIEEDPRYLLGSYSDTEFEVYTATPSIVFTSHYIDGNILCYHTAGIESKDYRVYQNKLRSYRPSYYTSKGDLDIMWSTYSVILVEGVFDRAAIKNAYPNRAVVARLSKGMPYALSLFLNRMVKTIWVAYDMDAPGDKGVEAVEKVLSNLEVIRLKFPTKDPGDLFLKGGSKKVRSIFDPQFLANEW